jgi:hypothetical protein
VLWVINIIAFAGGGLGFEYMLFLSTGVRTLQLRDDSVGVSLVYRMTFFAYAQWYAHVSYSNTLRAWRHSHWQP